MEIDILNDLLTKTVASLFQNREKHISYLSEDDSDNDNSNIFTQETFNNNKYTLDNHNNNKLHSTNGSNHSNINETNPKQNQPSLIDNIINNNINKMKNNENNKPNVNITPKEWCSTIGQKKFEESMRRLKINEQIITSKKLINEMSLEALINEKARVKQELKKYDEDFCQVFKYKPSKEYKEIMKPLYYYYQKLKIGIEKKSSLKNNQNNDNNNNYNSNSIRSGNTYNQDSSYSNITNSNMTNYTGTNNENDNRVSILSTMTNNNNNMGGNTYAYHRKANSGGGQIKNEDVKIQMNHGQKRSMSKEEINALEQEYFSIKKEQNNLTTMLRNYQNEFQRTNNRKVKWTKDIKPVENEYNKYKANKERLKQIKELFGHTEQKK